MILTKRFRSNLIVSSLLFFSCTNTKVIEGKWLIMNTSSSLTDTTLATMDVSNMVTTSAIKKSLPSSITINSKQIIFQNRNGDELSKENYNIILVETDYCKIRVGEDTAIFYDQLQPVEFTIRGITYFLKQK